MRTSIQELMEQTGVGFGTSGARGLVSQMTDRVCYAYTHGFLAYLESLGAARTGAPEVTVAGDLRPSTARIMMAVLRAAQDRGYTPVNCGTMPSPALALDGLTRAVPAVMVTGSHIPADRNGLKFNKPTGEILKADEAGIRSQVVELNDSLFDSAGQFASAAPAAFPIRRDAEGAYVARYLEAFPPNALDGCRIGVYQHSAVGRDLLVRILQGLGADVTPLGRADEFTPVDTEAIRPEDIELARRWATEPGFDAVVSTDGDSDRPLVSDEYGRWLRGDIAGVLCARYLQADSVSTPVSCNTAVERCGWFREVRRTRIGSPYVVEAMMAASAAGARRVVGYEANGGFLLDSDLSLGGRTLRALPTRDAAILILGVLLLARQEGRTVSSLAATLPARFTTSGLLRPCVPEQSQALMQRFSGENEAQNRQAIEGAFGAALGRAAQVDRTDGLRVTFENGEVLHLRPSGNAPEFRCYTEAGAARRAQELQDFALTVLRSLLHR